MSARHLVVFSGNVPTSDRVHAEQRKVAAGDELSGHHWLGLAIDPYVERHRRKRRQVVEKLILFPKLPKNWIVKTEIRFVVFFTPAAQQHNRFGILDRKRFEHGGVNQAEDRRIRPDAEREREHGHGGKAAVLQQLAEGEFEVIHNAMLPSDRLSQRGARAANLRYRPRA